MCAARVRRAGCSDSTNYAPPANAKCMRNQPRARMPPNGRNCASPPPPPFTPRRARASRRRLMHVCTSCIQRYSRAGTKYPHELTSHEEVSFLSLPPCRTALPRSPSCSPPSFFVPPFIVLPHPLVRDFSSRLPSHRVLFQSLVVAVYYTRREHTIPFSLCLLHKRNSVLGRIAKVTRDQTSRGLCVLCASGFYRVCKTELSRDVSRCGEGERERGKENEIKIRAEVFQSR